MGINRVQAPKNVPEQRVPNVSELGNKKLFFVVLFSQGNSKFPAEHRVFLHPLHPCRSRVKWDMYRVKGARVYELKKGQRSHLHLVKEHAWSRKGQGEHSL